MKEGKVRFFIDTAGNRHGAATVPGEPKEVFLPVAHMKAVENGALRKFRDGEERKYPVPGSVILLEYQVMHGSPLATKWGVAQ